MRFDDRLKYSMKYWNIMDVPREIFPKKKINKIFMSSFTYKVNPWIIVANHGSGFLKLLVEWVFLQESAKKNISFRIYSHWIAFHDFIGFYYEKSVKRMWIHVPLIIHINVQYFLKLSQVRFHSTFNDKRVLRWLFVQ